MAHSLNALETLQIWKTPLGRGIFSGVGGSPSLFNQDFFPKGRGGKVKSAKVGRCGLRDCFFWSSVWRIEAFSAGRKTGPAVQNIQDFLGRGGPPRQKTLYSADKANGPPKRGCGGVGSHGQGWPDLLVLTPNTPLWAVRPWAVFYVVVGCDFRYF